MENSTIEALEKLVALKDETIKELERQLSLEKGKNLLTTQPNTAPVSPVMPNYPYDPYTPINPIYPPVPWYINQPSVVITNSTCYHDFTTLETTAGCQSYCKKCGCIASGSWYGTLTQATNITANNLSSNTALCG